VRARAHSDTSLVDMTPAIMGGSWSFMCLLALIADEQVHVLASVCCGHVFGGFQE